MSCWPSLTAEVRAEKAEIRRRQSIGLLFDDDPK
jgi:hypothetical protein